MQDKYRLILMGHSWRKMSSPVPSIAYGYRICTACAWLVCDKTWARLFLPDTPESTLDQMPRCGESDPANHAERPQNALD